MMRLCSDRVGRASPQVLLGLALVGGCAEVSAPLPLDVSYAGCATVGSTCELRTPGAELTLAIVAPSGARLRVRSSEGAVERVVDEVEEIVRLHPDGVGDAVQVEVTTEGGEGRWSLDVRPEPDARLAEARSLLGSDPAAARALALQALAQTPERDVARVRSLLARVAYRERDIDQALELYGAALDGHLDAGRVHDAVWDGLALAFLLREVRQEPAAARRVLDRLAAAPLPPERGTLALLAQARGQLALSVGNLAEATAQFEEALALLERVQPGGRYHGSMLSDLGEALRRGGRWPEAVALHSEALDMGIEQDCVRARTWSNLGWDLLTSAGVHQLPPEALPLGDDPRAYFEAAIARYEEHCPAAEDDLRLLRLHMALADLRGGRPVAAARALAQLTAEVGEGVPFRRVLDLALAEQALAEGRWEEALEGARDVAVRAELALDLETLSDARSLIPRALAGMDRVDEAIEAHERTLDMAFREAALMPALLGRAAFLARRVADTRHHVGLLVAQGRSAEALRVVRTLRAQAVQSLRAVRQVEALEGPARDHWEDSLGAFAKARAERDRQAAELWSLEDAALEAAEQRLEALQATAMEALGEAFSSVGTGAWQPRSPTAGEALVAWFELDDGWWAFGATADGAVAGPVPGGEPPPDAEAWLAPVALAVRSAERVTLLPSGALRHRDLHALPFEGAPLFASRPVAWSVDVAGQGSHSRASEGTPAALVVSDPRGDLPRARAEAADAREVLADAGLSVVALSQHEATRDAVVLGLGQVGLLHYAGHGRYVGGRWGAELLLAEQTTLGVPDVLAARSVPRRVVLAGCETAQTEGTLVENLGLAQAFVTAGSEAAIAAVRPVDDAVAADFVAALYAADIVRADPAVAFQRALLATAQRHPTEDLLAFRLIRA